MSVDVFQEKIRKTKNPSVLQLEALPDMIPPHVMQAAGSIADAYACFAKELLRQLKGIVPAVRFGFGSFAMLGCEGLTLLAELLREAKSNGFYVLLDMPELLSPMAAERTVAVLAGEDTIYPCDGIVVSAYLGSDVLKPFLELCRAGRTLFPVVRTSNKTAPEIQDLLAGGRLVHTAAADIANRCGEQLLGKCGYSQVGVLAAASSADSLRKLRAKYDRMFLLLDGYDYPNANAKNCSFAFDKLGHGAAACAGASIAAAWKEVQTEDFAAASVEAAQRMKKNLTRYITVL